MTSTERGVRRADTAAVSAAKDSEHDAMQRNRPHVRKVALASLVMAESPRSAGVDHAHVQRLAEAEWPLPPILVHRPTMRIIDGFHRVTAAHQLGHSDIDAQLLDQSLEAAFVMAVESNVTHGLPLPLSDRRKAAATILSVYPHWSDRAVAKATGLSAKTVSHIRCAADDNQQLHSRVGRDGRTRPLDAAAGRRRAADLIAARPGASLREIALEAGISPGTVRDVRARLDRGEDPVGERRSRRDVPIRGKRRQSNGGAQAADIGPVLETLSRDPAMRMSAVGRETLRWLHRHAVRGVDGSQIAESVPEHCLDHLVEYANRCAATWARIAADLAQRAEAGATELSLPAQRCS